MRIALSFFGLNRCSSRDTSEFSFKTLCADWLTRVVPALSRAEPTSVDHGYTDNRDPIAEADDVAVTIIDSNSKPCFNEYRLR